MNKLTINEFINIPKETSGIYKITNIVNNRFYIGQAGCFVRRWKIHIKEIKKNNHENEYFQNDYNKCGADINNLRFEIIEECPNTKEDLDFNEQKYIDLYWDNRKQCYNIAKYVNSPNKGRKLSEAVKKKIGEKNKGKVASAEARAKMSNAHKGKKGTQYKEQCINIFQYDVDGNFIMKHTSTKSAAREIKNLYNSTYKISPTSISNSAKNNINPNNISSAAYGFIWLLTYFGEKIFLSLKNKKRHERFFQNNFKY